MPFNNIHIHNNPTIDKEIVSFSMKYGTKFSNMVVLRLFKKLYALS